MSNLTPDPAAVPSQSVRVVNVPNGLTVLRLLLVPLFAALLLHEGGTSVVWRVAAAAAFVVASLTDQLDGHIARSRGLITDFGKLADPIADKALTGTALVSLSMLGLLPWWVTVVVIGREVAVTALRFWVIRHGVIPASRGGKLKTLLQAVAVTSLVLPGSLPATVGMWVMGAAVLVTVVTGGDYVARAVALRRSARHDGRP